MPKWGRLLTISQFDIYIIYTIAGITRPKENPHLAIIKSCKSEIRISVSVATRSYHGEAH